MKTYFSIQQANRKADIYIFGDIVPFEWYPGDVSAYGLKQQIENLDVDQIDVHIDSYGGAVSEGWAIYNTLRANPAKIVTYGDGFVASAALYPFMAGDERYASNLSAYFLHEVVTGAYGYAKDLHAAAEEAELFTEIGTKAFTERTEMTEEEVRELMAAETWLTPEQALERGIATAIVSDELPNFAQSAKRAFMQRFMRPQTPPQTPPPTEKTPKEKFMQALSGLANL